MHVDSGQIKPGSGPWVRESKSTLNRVSIVNDTLLARQVRNRNESGAFAMTAKKWTKEEIAAKLATDDKWLIRGLLAIYAGQTEEEKL